MRTMAGAAALGDLAGALNVRGEESAIVAALKQDGVLINAIGGTSFRAVTHLDVSTKQIDAAVEAFARVLR